MRSSTEGFRLYSQLHELDSAIICYAAAIKLAKATGKSRRDLAIILSNRTCCLETTGAAQLVIDDLCLALEVDPTSKSREDWSNRIRALTVPYSALHMSSLSIRQTEAELEAVEKTKDLRARLQQAKGHARSKGGRQ